MDASAESLPSLPAGDVRLPSDMFQAKLRHAVADDFVTELKKATLHVNGAIPKEASGKSCPTSTAEAIKEKCQTAEANFSSSGTLSQLNLDANAISSLDVGTIRMVMDNATSINRLQELIGPITINIDSWTGSELIQLVRADKDGYVQALCLIILWCSDDTDLSKSLESLATDLVFKFQKLGQGLGFLSKCMCMCMGRS